MKLSQLISVAQEILDKNGDLKIALEISHQGYISESISDYRVSILGTTKFFILES